MQRSHIHKSLFPKLRCPCVDSASASPSPPFPKILLAQTESQGRWELYRQRKVLGLVGSPPGGNGPQQLDKATINYKTRFLKALPTSRSKEVGEVLGDRATRTLPLGTLIQQHPHLTATGPVNNAMRLFRCQRNDCGIVE